MRSIRATLPSKIALTKIALTKIALTKTALLLICSIPAVAVPVSSGTTELKNGWRLASAWNVVRRRKPHLAIFLRCFNVVRNSCHAGHGTGDPAKRMACIRTSISART